MRVWGLACLFGFLATQALAKPLEVTDFRGKRLRLAEPPRRIVCLIESALSGLYMLGAQGRVVAVSANVYAGEVHPRYAALDPRLREKKLPAPGNWDFVNLESVAALSPDLVILWSEQKESIAALEEGGVPVYAVFIDRKEDVYREIEDLGRLTGTEKRAAELVAWAEAELRSVEDRLGRSPELKRPGVYYMWAQGDLETSCRGSTVDDLIRLGGG